MAFTKFTKDPGVISALPNKPNTSDGLTPAALKAKFDELGTAIKAYLNETLLAELEGTGGAGNLGYDNTGSSLAAATIQGALDELKEAIDSATTGQLPSGSVTTAKLKDLAVTTEKLSELAVATAKLADAAVTAAKLAAGAVETAKLADGAVTEAKIAAAAVSAGKLSSGAVTTEKLAESLLVPVAKGGTGGATAEAARTALGAQKTLNKATFGLSVNGWENKSQTAVITGMTEDSEFVAAPSDVASWAAAADAMLYPPTPGDGTLTFTCDETPAAAINVTVYWW